MQGLRVVRLESLKKALYPALDHRYYKMIEMNMKALERGARFVTEGT